MNVKLVWITQNAEEIMGHCARVSNPANQGKPFGKLMDHCAKNGHWSVFEMANMCLEIETLRGITPQILRHRSFHFQEFSQRYAVVSEFLPVDPRRQDTKNRQNSIDDLSDEVKDSFKKAQEEIESLGMARYQEAIDNGIAKESARFLLPSSAKSTLYMSGTIRDWMHYIRVRTEDGVQLEHKEIAFAAQRIFTEQLPDLASLLVEIKMWLPLV